MTALPAPVLDTRASDQQAGDVAVLEALLAAKVTSADRVGAGRNSRVYRVGCAGQEYAAKFYFGPTADGRDRLEVEFSALTFLWERGMRCIARPLQADRARQVALYEFVDGEPIDAADAGPADIDQLLAFAAELRRLAGDPAAAALPPAAEAFFAIPDVIHNLRSRFQRLQAVTRNPVLNPQTPDPRPETPALRTFLSDLAPALDRFAAQAAAAGEGELPRRYRTLSPSDLGFHNALRAATRECQTRDPKPQTPAPKPQTPDPRPQTLRFLDFEYFGWDDPAKMLCDAQLHPRMQLQPEQRRRLAAGFDSIFGADPGWRARVDALYPLFALKWCLIMLNEFRPEQIERRRYVDGAGDRIEAIQLRQLATSRAMLAGILQQQGAFPYWESNA